MKAERRKDKIKKCRERIMELEEEISKKGEKERNLGSEIQESQSQM